MVTFEVPKNTTMEIAVYNLCGEKVKTLFSGPLLSGRHIIPWDGTDERGAWAASGIYFIQARGEEVAAAAKIVLVR